MRPAPTLAVIVVAAGSGTRLGRAEPKAFVELAGRPILAHALESVFGIGEAAQVVVVAPPTYLEPARAIAEAVAGPAVEYVRVVAGGSTRQSSVHAGLRVVERSVRTVLVHDAARPLTPSAQFEAVARAVTDRASGIVPSLPVTDTIKRVDAGEVIETVDRSALAAVQTPQGFPRLPLEAAYDAAVEEYTDDAALFAAAGYPVRVVDGSPVAFKITTGWDLRRAERELRGVGLRTGIGTDVHGFDPAAPLWLGGLHWPGEPGLAGHSDGDVVAHAICDALLSAAGLGDIGGVFGSDDPLLADAAGEVFLRRTTAMLEEAGFRILNVAVQLVAIRPKIGPRRREIETRLTALLRAPVSVSATTSDGLGFTGRGEGIAALATALLSRA